MRRVLFCHCGFVNKFGNNFYVSTSYSDEVMSRYFLLGDEVELVAEQGRPKDCIQSQRYSKSTLEHMTITPVPKIGRTRELIFLWKRRRIVEEAVRRSDVVVARLPSGAGFLAIKYAKKYRKPYMLEVVGCAWESLFNYNWKGKCLAWFKWRKMRNAVRNAPYAVYVSNSFLQKRYPCKGNTVAISNVMIARDRQGNILDEREKQLKGKNENSKFIIGTAAAVNVPYKGQGLIIQAVAELKKRGIVNIEYQLAGGGDSSRLMELAKRENVENQICFKGNVPHSEMANWFKSLDCYVQPSYQEGLPRAVIEAMNYATPCIVSDAGGTPELIDAEFVFKQKTEHKQKIQEIADLIVKVTNPQTRREQSKRNYEESMQYDQEILSQRRTNFYKDFINRYFGE